MMSYGDHQQNMKRNVVSLSISRTTGGYAQVIVRGGNWNYKWCT